jgi:hypothetical protein
VGESRASKIESSTFSTERDIPVCRTKENILEQKPRRMAVATEKAHGRGNKYLYDYSDTHTNAKAHSVM